MAPSLFSTFSAVTELFVTAAVLWFFVRALGRKEYRWGIITTALVYETLFNITYMATRLTAHTGPDVERPAWYIALVAGHGLLSLVMFLGLIALVVWSHQLHSAGDPDPLGRRRRLSYTFLALWMVSILSGEVIYVLQWTDLAVS